MTYVKVRSTAYAGGSDLLWLEPGFHPVPVDDKPQFDPAWHDYWMSGGRGSCWTFCGPAAPLPKPVRRRADLSEELMHGRMFAVQTITGDGRIFTYRSYLPHTFVEVMGIEAAWRYVEEESAAALAEQEEGR